LVIEVWSDYICPWCYLTLDRVDHIRRAHSLEVAWQPYELHPDVPHEGAPVRRMSTRGELRDELGRAGLPISRRDTISNSARALALSAWATGLPEWPTLHRSLFDAYWAQGRDLGDPTVLVDIASAAGIDPGSAETAVAAGAGRETVAAARERALDLGIAGTPGWHFGDGIVLVGAHATHILDRVIARR